MGAVINQSAEDVLRRLPVRSPADASPAMRASKSAYSFSSPYSGGGGGGGVVSCLYRFEYGSCGAELGTDESVESVLAGCWVNTHKTSVCNVSLAVWGGAGRD